MILCVYFDDFLTPKLELSTLMQTSKSKRNNMRTHSIRSYDTLPLQALNFSINTART